MFALAGLAVAAIGLRDRVDAEAVADPTVAIPTLALTAVSTAAAARSWSAITTEHRDRGGRRRGEFYRAQLAKYLPAGPLVTAVSQAALASGDTGRRQAVVALGVNALGVVGAGLVFGPLVATDSELAGPLRLALLAAPLGLVVLHRPLMMAVLERIPRLRDMADAVPAQSAVLRSFGWSVVNMTATATAFVLLLDAVDPDVHASFRLVGAFALAWVIGFLIVPLPSGLGARELVIYALAPGVAGAAVVTASVMHRFATIVAEVALAGITWRSAVATDDTSLDV